MEFREYLSVLRSRWISVVSCVLIFTALAGVSTLRTPKMYDARASVFFSVSVGQSSSDLSSGFSYIQGLVDSYAQVATQTVVLAPVITELGLKTTAKALARSVTVEVPLDTVIIDIQVQNSSPDQAAKIANAIARQLSVSVASVIPGVTSKASAVQVTVVAPASAPRSASSPRVSLNLTLAAVAGLLAGIILAFGRDVLDARIGGRRDVERITDVPIIGTVAAPEDGSLRGRWFRSRRNRSEDRARELRTNFQHVRVARRLRSVVFTSAQHDRTTGPTVTSLGVELAHAGLNTLLVDGDLRNPTLAGWFGADDTVGLSTVLLGQIDWRDAIQHRGRTLLSILPAGLPLEDPSAILDPAVITVLLQELTDHFDIVMIKAPPVLRVADGLLFARLSDGTIIVADGPAMHRDELAEELHTLGVADAQLLGIVLTA